MLAPQPMSRSPSSSAESASRQDASLQQQSPRSLPTSAPTPGVPMPYLAYPHPHPPLPSPHTPSSSTSMSASVVSPMGVFSAGQYVPFPPGFPPPPSQQSGLHPSPLPPPPPPPWGVGGAVPHPLFLPGFLPSPPTNLPYMGGGGRGALMMTPPHPVYFRPMRAHDQSLFAPSPAAQTRPAVAATTTAADPFMESWLRTVSSSTPKQAERPQVQFMKIPEVRSELMKGAELLSQLRSTHQAMSALPPGAAEEWTVLKSRMECDKTSFLGIREALEKQGQREHLCKKVSRLCSLRERKKRLRKRRREERLASLETAERNAREWIQDQEQKKLKAKTEKAVHASASGVLAEVKRKITDVKQLLDLAEALKELRSLRRENSRKKGDAPPIEADERFQQTHGELVEMLTKQAGVYQQEEHALRVLLEEEVMEKMHSQRRREEPAVFVPDLFWPTPAPSDPMEACKNFYLCARASEEARIAIRSEWDSFICSTEEGSLLTPPPPPSSSRSALAWKQYCTHTPSTSS